MIYIPTLPVFFILNMSSLPKSIEVKSNLYLLIDIRYKASKKALSGVAIKKSLTLENPK